MSNEDQRSSNPMVKVVYFDEQSVSDYLDIAAGGSATTVRKNITDRTKRTNAKVQAAVTAKLSWLPFFGVNGETGAGVELARAGQTLLSKTLSNTILTDYLEQAVDDGRVHRLTDIKVRAAAGSMTEAKMLTPYMIAAKDMDPTVDVARLDEAFERAKGYYELVAISTSDEADRCVLRFNLRAFRNNYGLADLSRMRLVYHAVLVGETSENSLTIDAELGETAKNKTPNMSGLDIVKGNVPQVDQGQKPLNVYDVLLAGVEHGRL